MPEEFFGEPKAIFVAQAQHDAEVVERAHGASALVGAAEIEHEAATGFEHALDGFGELE